MGRNKTLKERITTLKGRIEAHEQKKRQELQRDPPDVGLIDHWQGEIDNWRVQIGRAEQRLKRQR
jgi:hypothetical protein